MLAEILGACSSGGRSHELVGDVRRSTDPTLRLIHSDELSVVDIPGAEARTDDASQGKAIGVVFNGAPPDSPRFRVTGQQAPVAAGAVAFDGSARLLFATDSGTVAAWTERAVDGSVVRVDGPAITVFDGSKEGMALGDALDYAAGPEDETDGEFGVLRPASGTP